MGAPKVLVEVTRPTVSAPHALRPGDLEHKLISYIVFRLCFLFFVVFLYFFV